MSDQSASEQAESSIAALSFCPTNLAGLQQWAADLPLVNTTETTKQLLLAVAELAILEVSPAERLALVEELRPLVHYVCARVDRLALQSQTANSMAATHAMQHNLYRCYHYVFSDAQDLEASRQTRELLLQSGHRLLSELSIAACRSLQFYLPLPDKFWKLLHQTFVTLSEAELADSKVNDPENSTQSVSCRDMYVRTLLMAACKPNQLKQDQLRWLHVALEHWAKHAEIAPAAEKSTLYVVDVESNDGPSYRQFAEHSDSLWGLDTSVLAYEIDAFLGDVSTSLHIPEGASQPLLGHLAKTWSVLPARKFNRQQAPGELRVCVGLAAVHYFLSGGVQFEYHVKAGDSLMRREINPFLDVEFEGRLSKYEDDPWNQIYESGIVVQELPFSVLDAGTGADADAKRPFQHFVTSAINTSPGGYQIRWSGSIPHNSKVGDVIAIREEEDARWSVALIRWISRHSEHATMGVELLSPRAIPVALRPKEKLGGAAHFVRGLILPGLSVIGQPATLVTAHGAFKPQQKVSITRQGIQGTALLLEKLQMTESMSQFTFRMLDGYLEKSGSARNMDDVVAITREDTTQGT